MANQHSVHEFCKPWSSVLGAWLGQKRAAKEENGYRQHGISIRLTLTTHIGPEHWENRNYSLLREHTAISHQPICSIIHRDIPSTPPSTFSILFLSFNFYIFPLLVYCPCLTSFSLFCKKVVILTVTDKQACLHQCALMLPIYSQSSYWQTQVARSWCIYSGGNRGLIYFMS